MANVSHYIKQFEGSSNRSGTSFMQNLTENIDCNESGPTSKRLYLTKYWGEIAGRI